MTKTIITTLTERLNRNLKQHELEAFKLDRTQSVYQLMLDYVFLVLDKIKTTELYGRLSRNNY